MGDRRNRQPAFGAKTASLHRRRYLSILFFCWFFFPLLPLFFASLVWVMIRWKPLIPIHRVNLYRISSSQLRILLWCQDSLSELCKHIRLLHTLLPGMCIMNWKTLLPFFNLAPSFHYRSVEWLLCFLKWNVVIVVMVAQEDTCQYFLITSSLFPINSREKFLLGKRCHFHCSWKLVALSLTVLTLILSSVIAYFGGKKDISELRFIFQWGPLHISF